MEIVCIHVCQLISEHVCVSLCVGSVELIGGQEVDKVLGGTVRVLLMHVLVVVARGHRREGRLAVVVLVVGDVALERYGSLLMCFLWSW